MLKPPRYVSAVLPSMSKALRPLLCLLWLFCASAGATTTLVLESWRTEDQQLWNTVLIPAFEKSHPDIRLKFSPTVRELYDAALDTRLKLRTAGDLIACRPYDQSQDLFRSGHLLALDGLDVLQPFPPASREAWQTDDLRHTFCLPVAAVVQGFFYNRKVLERLDLREPRNLDELETLMERVRAEPGHVVLAHGTADPWESHQLLLTTVGPAHWDGARGRQRLLRGEQRLTDPPFLAAWEWLAQLADYLPMGYQAHTYTDAMDSFGSGTAALRVGGSWEIPALERYRPLQLGAFPPPAGHTGQACHAVHHADMGMGINPASPRREAAMRFLAWLGSAEFTQLLANAAVGFYPLASHPVEIAHPLAREMLAWTRRCNTDIRLNAQHLNRGRPRSGSAMEHEFWTVNAMVLNRQIKPLQAVQRLQEALDAR
jgi:raffinose/stachyose/melibiose transport system substrate-binding protein